MRAVPLAAKASGEGHRGDARERLHRRVPARRFLYLYVNYKPGTELDPLRASSSATCSARTGQEIVVKDGYYPILKPIADKALASVGLAAARPSPADEKPTGSDGKQR